MAKPRITDLRIRAQIEGPFTAVRTSIADAVRLEEAAQSIGLFVVRYQFNYVCISQNGDDMALNGLVDELARQKGIQAELIVTGAENVIEALMWCWSHLAKREPGRALEIARPGSTAPEPKAQEEYPQL